MLPVTVHAFISAPREEVFDFIADYGARPAWCDHMMKDYRLAHPDARGEGAGARYLLDAPGFRHYAEATLTKADRPREILEALHGGRNWRSRGEIVWEFTREAGSQTGVTVTFVWEPGTPREAFKERFGSRGWTKRQLGTALERLRLIMEEEPGRPLAHATIAGFEPLRSPRFGASPKIARG